MTTPWDIYAEQLLPVGYGHPLWIPEPNEREVDIGDVGWLKEGEFRPLFNSMKRENDPVNVKGVPLSFDIFNPHNVSISTCDKIFQHIVCSRSVRTIETSGDVAAGSTTAQTTAGIGFQFRSTTDSGAFVMLEPPGQSRDIESKRHIVNYMRDHFENWLEFANASTSWGLDLKEQDIIFVCGTTKTTRWAVAAFQGNTFRQKEGHVQGDFGPYASGGFSVNISNQILPANHYRTGPSFRRLGMPRPALTQPGDSNLAIPEPSQCLFVHYYKMKRRFLLFKEPMRAAAGSHHLPPGPDNPGMDTMGATSLGGSSPSAYEFVPEDVPGQGEAYDPVNCLLDYILAQTEAECAIASDLDLMAIFNGGELPNQQDLRGALNTLSPSVEVDERGVGTISVGFRLHRKRRSDVGQEQELEEPEPVGKRLKTPEGLPTPGPSGGLLPASSQQDRDRAVPAEEDSFGGASAPRQRDALIPPEHLPQAIPDTPVPPEDIVHGATIPTLPPAAPNNHANVVNSDGEDETGPVRRIAGVAIGSHEGSVTALAYSADGRYAASGSEDTTIILWDVFHHTVMHKLEGSPDTISSLAFSRDNQILAAATHAEVIVLWFVDHGTQMKDIQVDQPMHSIAYTPDGRYLVGGAEDGTLQVWDVEDYAQQMVLEHHTAAVTFIVFSSNGRFMATGGTESDCCIWEIENLARGRPFQVLQGHQGMVTAAAFSPDSRRIITASDDGSSWVWNAESGESLVHLHEHTGPVWSVAFSPDGRRIASGSSDSSVKVCDSFSGDRVLSLEGHDSMINAVEFSSDGKYIASAASDNTVRLWSAEDGAAIRTYNEHNDNVTAAMFSSDSSSLMSGSHDGTVRIRPLMADFVVE